MDQIIIIIIESGVLINCNSWYEEAVVEGLRNSP